jgi:hypothetical protein
MNRCEIPNPAVALQSHPHRSAARISRVGQLAARRPRSRSGRSPSSGCPRAGPTACVRQFQIGPRRRIDEQPCEPPRLIAAGRCSAGRSDILGLSRHRPCAARRRREFGAREAAEPVQRTVTPKYRASRSLPRWRCRTATPGWALTAIRPKLVDQTAAPPDRETSASGHDQSRAVRPARDRPADVPARLSPSMERAGRNVDPGVARTAPLKPV